MQNNTSDKKEEFVPDPKSIKYVVRFFGRTLYAVGIIMAILQWGWNPYAISACLFVVLGAILMEDSPE